MIYSARRDNMKIRKVIEQLKNEHLVKTEEVIIEEGREM